MAQTDTTVGFLSQNDKKLFEIKQRDSSKPFIKIYKDFKTFLSYKNRIPQNQKKFVRHSKKITFIVKNKAFRVTKNHLNSTIFDKLDWYYSTSANRSRENFDKNFCKEKSDIIIEDANSLKETTSSNLIKINNFKKKRLR